MKFFGWLVVIVLVLATAYVTWHYMSLPKAAGIQEPVICSTAKKS